MLTYTLQLKYVYTAVTVMTFALTVGQCQQKPCDTFAVVRDNTGLDGCGILFETENDGLLLPQNFGQLNMAAINGDTIAISYTIVKDAMSVCMAENAIVEVSCIGMVSKIECDEIKDPFGIAWARKAMQVTEATQVSMIASNPRSFYVFSGKSGCRLYDCEGQLLCEGPCGVNEQCARYFQDRGVQTKDPKVIYVMNE
jgi:hypothetical protein